MLVDTPSHGGLRLYGPGRKLIPEAVSATFWNGPEWAEEDCDMYIALAVAYKNMSTGQRQVFQYAVENGVVPTPEVTLEVARRICREFPRYGVCAMYL